MKRGGGFTLVETLITLSLAVFLLLVVWRMFDVYTKIEDKGVRASQKAAVVRAVQRQLRSDLRLLVYIDPTQPAPTQVANPDQSVYPSNVTRVYTLIRISNLCWRRLCWINIDQQPQIASQLPLHSTNHRGFL